MGTPNDLVKDIHLKFDALPKEPDKNTRIIIIVVSDTIVGLIVNSVNEVVQISKNVTEPYLELLNHSQ